MSIVIVSWNTRDALARALSSIRAQAGVSVEVLVVDNASADGSAELVRSRFSEVRLFAQDRNRGFAAANNVGLNEARGEVLLCLNPDASLRPGALSALVSWFRGRPERDGVVGCALEDGAGRPERTYGRFPAAREFVSRPFRRESAAEGGGARRVDWVTGAFLAMRRAVVAAGVRFDEGYPLYVEDVDLCRQAKRAGFDVWYEPRDWARHDRGGAPAGAARRRLRRLGEARFLRKWGGVGAWPLAAAYWLVAGGWRRDAYRLPVAPEVARARKWAD